MAPLRVSTTKSEWLPDHPTAFVPTRLWKLPFITTWDDSRNQNRPTDSAEEAQFHFSERVEGSEELSRAKSALNLFRSLQTLLTLNHYKVDDETKAELYRSGSLCVNETISTPASHERIMRFKEGSLIKDGVPETIYVKA